MAKLSGNIYGTDPVSMASDIADDALTTSGLDGSGVWGGVTDSRANSWDGLKEPQPGDVEIIKNLKSGSGDDGNMDSDFSKITPRHRPAIIKGDESTYVAPKRFSGK